MVEIGYNFLKKDLNKIQKFKIPTLDIVNYRKYKRALPRVARHNARSHIPCLLKGRI